MNVVLYIAEALFVAYLMRLAAYRFGIPAVSAYVVGGVILGGSLFVWIPGFSDVIRQWIFSPKALDDLEFITTIALGAIALTIGAELEWRQLRKMGASIVCIAFSEAIGAFLCVFLLVWLVFHDMPLGLLLGAVSAATAPAATVAVIDQYRARGPLTQTILAVVGIDDAVSFMLFAFILALAKGMLGGGTITLATGLVLPMVAIAKAVLLGSVIGFIGGRLMSSARDHDSLVFLLGAAILATSGCAHLLDVSDLLANMAGGAMIVNQYPRLKMKIRSGLSAFLPVFYALFFIIGGAHLDLTSFPAIWLVAIVYFLARTAGKISGATFGATIGGASPAVRRWVGFGLLPQVGAALALALVIRDEFGSGAYGDRGVMLSTVTINVLLVTTLVTEFVGPYLTKMILFKTGEAKE